MFRTGILVFNAPMLSPSLHLCVFWEKETSPFSISLFPSFSFVLVQLTQPAKNSHLISSYSPASRRYMKGKTTNTSSTPTDTHTCTRSTSRGHTDTTSSTTSPSPSVRDCPLLLKQRWQCVYYSSERCLASRAKIQPSRYLVWNLYKLKPIDPFSSSLLSFTNNFYCEEKKRKTYSTTW